MVREIGAHDDFAYTGAVVEYTIPFSGIFLLECYGACGGYFEVHDGHILTGNETYYDQGRDKVGIAYQAPLGGYAKGYKAFKKGQKIYVACGGFPGGPIPEKLSLPTPDPTWSKGGFNGGGDGARRSAGVGHGANTYLGYNPGLAGGGATHMALITGTIAEIGYDRRGQILLVAGGGGGSCGTQASANAGDSAPAGLSQHMSQGGGEQSDPAWEMGSYFTQEGFDFRVPAATQTRGYAFGQGAPCRCNAGDSDIENVVRTSQGGGGGGWYGGYNTVHGSAEIQYSHFCSGSGGSGYIGGVPAFTYHGTTYTPQNIKGGNEVAGAGRARITYVAKYMPGIKFRNERTGETDPTEIDMLYFQDCRTGGDGIVHEIVDVYFAESPSATPVLLG